MFGVHCNLNKPLGYFKQLATVNSEILAMVLISRKFAFCEDKPSRKSEITLSSTDESRFFTVTNMSFNAIRKHKILAKISGFKVIGSDYR